MGCNGSLSGDVSESNYNNGMIGNRRKDWSAIIVEGKCGWTKPWAIEQ